MKVSVASGGYWARGPNNAAIVHGVGKSIVRARRQTENGVCLVQALGGCVTIGAFRAMCAPCRLKAQNAINIIASSTEKDSAGCTVW